MKKYDILLGIQSSLSSLAAYIEDLTELDEESENESTSLNSIDSCCKEMADNTKDIATNISAVEEAIYNAEEYSNKKVIPALEEISDQIKVACYDIADSIFDNKISGEIEQLRESFEYSFHDVEEFITVTRTNGSKINIRHTDISCVMCDEDNDTEIDLNNGKELFVNEKPEEIMELIRKAKRTEYQKYCDTLTENGLTEDEIKCYVAYQQPDLVCPYMTMEQILSKIGEVKKAKAEGFDFSVEKLVAERDKLYEEERKKSGRLF
jgi:uncharacterized protein YlzI (FlbEa/FlbD family)